MKIMIIGAGNMGGAIARGLISGTVVEAKDITVVDISKERLYELKSENNDIHIVSSITKRDLQNTDVIMLAVKPWLIENVIVDLKFNLDYKKQLIVSVAAGITFERLNGFLKKDEHLSPVLFRVIPNTAISISQSVTFISSCNANSKQEELIVSIFQELGSVQIIPENQIPAATSLASCGIAYAMRYIRAAMEGGIELGFYPEDAKNIVLQTVKGAVELLLKDGNHPESEIDKVTTAGGVTIQGLNEMEHAGFTSAVIRGLKKSTTI